MTHELPARTRWFLLASLLAAALVSVALKDDAPLASGVLLSVFAVVGMACASRDLVFGVVLLITAAALDIGGLIGEQGTVRFTVYQVMSAGVLVLLLLRLRATRTPIVRTPLDIPVLVFLVAMGITIAWAGDRGLAVLQLARLVSSALLAFIVVQVVRDSRQARSIVVMTLGVAATLGLLAVIEWSGAFALRYPVLETLGYGIRARVTFHDPNIFGSLLVTAALFALALVLIMRDSREQVIASLGILLVTAGILVTYSRGSLGGLIIGALAVVALSQLKSRTRMVVLALVVLALAAGASVVVDAQWIRDNVVDLENNDSAMWRVAVAEGAVKMWWDAPMGVGLGNFAEVFPRYQIPGSTGVTDSHTAYLTILAEAGIVGIASFLWLLWSFFGRITLPLVRCESQTVRGLAVGAFCAGFALCVQSFTYSLEASKFLWLTFGMGAAVWATTQEDPAMLPPARDAADTATAGNRSDR